MGLRDMLTSHLFKQDESGCTVVFPNGVMGRGYVVPDPFTETRMRRALSAMLIGSITFGVVGSLVVTFIYGIPNQWPYPIWGAIGAAMLAGALAYRLAVWQLVRDLAPSPARLTLFEAVEKQAQAMPPWYLWTMAGIGFGFCFGAIVMMFKASGSAEDRFLAFCGFILFAMIFLQAAYGLAKRKPTQGGPSN